MSSWRLPAFLVLVAIALTLPGEAVVIRNSSPVTLPFARRLNFTGAANLVQHDQARAKALKARATTSTSKFPKAPIINDPVTNGVVDYVANVSFHVLPEYYPGSYSMMLFLFRSVLEVLPLYVRLRSHLCDAMD